LIVGAAQLDITPVHTVELSGFAARQQPMTGVLDPIHVKALYLSQDDQKLLWMHFDLLALSGEFVSEFREWAAHALGIKHVLLSATHTHAAPAMVELTGCGRRDARYLRAIPLKAQEAARDALESAEGAQLLFNQVDCPLAIDRRGKPSGHVDSTLSGVWCGRNDNSILAAVVNYPMHPVALGHVNRQVSADWCGGAEAGIKEAVREEPIVLVTNGACGNLNPPARPVSPARAVELGRQIGGAFAGVRLQSGAAKLRIAVEHVEMLLDWSTPDEIDRVAAHRVAEFEGTEWAKPFRKAILQWRETQTSLVLKGEGKSIDIELFAIDLGPVVILAINGEVFSRFTAMLREKISKPLFVVGYANSCFGYIPTREAYEEGGYEVDQAHFFYNSFRPKAGSLEMLAERAVQRIQKLIAV
jgi:neutral ceramidase